MLLGCIVCIPYYWFGARAKISLPLKRANIGFHGSLGVAGSLPWILSLLLVSLFSFFHIQYVWLHLTGAKLNESNQNEISICQWYNSAHAKVQPCYQLSDTSLDKCYFHQMHGGQAVNNLNNFRSVSQGSLLCLLRNFPVARISLSAYPDV